MEQSDLGEVVPLLPELCLFLLPVSDGMVSTILEVLVCAIICGRGICCTLLLFFLRVVGVLFFFGVVSVLFFFGVVGVLLFFCVVGAVSLEVLPLEPGEETAAEWRMLIRWAWHCSVQQSCASSAQQEVGVLFFFGVVGVLLFFCVVGAVSLEVLPREPGEETAAEWKMLIRWWHCSVEHGCLLSAQQEGEELPCYSSKFPFGVILEEE
jgi:hypothetical protein